MGVAHCLQQKFSLFVFESLGGYWYSPSHLKLSWMAWHLDCTLISKALPVQEWRLNIVLLQFSASSCCLDRIPRSVLKYFWQLKSADVVCHRLQELCQHSTRHICHWRRIWKGPCCVPIRWSYAGTISHWNLVLCLTICNHPTCAGTFTSGG